MPLQAPDCTVEQALAAVPGGRIVDHAQAGQGSFGALWPFIDNYVRPVLEEARRRAVDGVVCDRIHKAEITEIVDLMYGNDSDWVESRTQHFLDNLRPIG